MIKEEIGRQKEKIKIIKFFQKLKTKRCDER